MQMKTLARHTRIRIRTPIRIWELQIQLQIQMTFVAVAVASSLLKYIFQLKFYTRINAKPRPAH